MDQVRSPERDGAPDVAAILERARQLTTDELVALAKRYLELNAEPEPTGSEPTGSESTGATATDPVPREGSPPDVTMSPSARRHVLLIARSRSGRPAEIRAVEVAVADAVRGVGSAQAHRTLVRLGLLDAAERAITDAALAALLADRLGAAQASELRRPWDDLG